MLAGVAELHAEAILDARVAHGPVDGAAGRRTEKVPDGVDEVDGPVGGEERLVSLLGDPNVVIDVGIVLGEVTPRVHDELVERLQRWLALSYVH